MLYILYNTQELLLVKTTRFYRDLLDTLEAKFNGTNPVKFKMYSASDVNVNSVLVSLGLSSYTTNFTEWSNPTTSRHRNT